MHLPGSAPLAIQTDPFCSLVLQFYQIIPQSLSFHPLDTQVRLFMLHTPSAYTGCSARMELEAVWSLPPSNPSPSLLTSGVVPMLGWTLERAGELSTLGTWVRPGSQVASEQRNTGPGGMRGRGSSACELTTKPWSTIKAEAKAHWMGPKGPQRALPSTPLAWEETIQF